MKALIIGATGATGKDLRNLLLNDTAYTEVVVFVRRNTGINHSKLTEVITDFDKPEAVTNHIHGDVLFSLLGTTLKTAGSKDNQYHIDYEIPLKFATLAKANGVNTLVLLSAHGASTTSRIFYSKLKGKLEQDITALAFQRLIIFQPGLLLRKNTDRPGERISAAVLNFLNGIGLMKRFKPLPTQLLAAKLAKAPLLPGPPVQMVGLDKIWEFK